MSADCFTATPFTEAARSFAPNDQTPIVPTAEVIEILRGCGKKLGLSPQVLRSLELLLTFLPPRRNHHIVFASNETLVHRAQGLHERSLRRHIAALAEAGLLRRTDSPNKKRYTCHDPCAGVTMRFGLDLGPLFARIGDLRILAEEAEMEAMQIAYQRRKLRAAASNRLALAPDDARAKELLKLARRQMSAVELAALLAGLPCPAESLDHPHEQDLTGSGGQIDRHLPNLSKELNEKEETEVLQSIAEKPPEAVSYALSSLQTAQDIEDHARTLAPMLGISMKLYQDAIESIGSWRVASLVWMIVENATKITKPAAYFRAITFSPKGAAYRAWEWLTRSRRFCPRTI